MAQGGRSTIFSSDKDLMQLIRPGIAMWDPIKQKAIGPAEVMEKFGVAPEKLMEAQALMGDSVDNVPGVPGIGPKTAAQLISEFGDLETVLAAAPAMKPSKRRDLLIEHAENARISRKLVELRHDAPLPLPLPELVAREADRPQLAAWLLTQGFRSTLSRLGLDEKAPSPVAAPGAETAEGAPGEVAPPPPVAVRADPVRAVRPVRLRHHAACAAGVDRRGRRRRRGRGRYRNRWARSACAPIWSACRSPPRRAAPATCRCATQGTLEHVIAAQISADAAVAALAPLLADPAVLKVFHNAKFDLAILARAGAPSIAPIDDTMLISFAQEAGAHGHGMDELAALHLGHTPISYDERHRHRRSRIRSARCRSSAPPPTPPRTPTSRCGSGRRCARGCAPPARSPSTSRSSAGCCGVLLAMERAGVKVDAADLRAMSQDFERAHGRHGAGHPSARRLPVQRRQPASSSAKCCSTGWGCPAAGA